MNIALSQAVVGIVLLIVAATLSGVWGDPAFVPREDGSWPPARWLAVAGLWFVGGAVAEIVVLEISFVPLRRA
ncbi:MAG: hypothetical protein WBC44_16515 [Planctomycetaceae bacterium]